MDDKQIMVPHAEQPPAVGRLSRARSGAFSEDQATNVSTGGGREWNPTLPSISGDQESYSSCSSEDYVSESSCGEEERNSQSSTELRNESRESCLGAMVLCRKQVDENIRRITELWTKLNEPEDIWERYFILDEIDSLEDTTKDLLMRIERYRKYC